MCPVFLWVWSETEVGVSVTWRHFLQNNAIRIAHVRSGSVFLNFPPRSIRLGKSTLCDFSPNSGYFAVGDSNGFLSLFRLNHFDKCWHEHSSLRAASEMWCRVFWFRVNIRFLLPHDFMLSHKVKLSTLRKRSSIEDIMHLMGLLHAYFQWKRCRY